MDIHFLLEKVEYKDSLISSNHKPILPASVEFRKMVLLQKMQELSEIPYLPKRSAET